jgi:hypothetical protein
MYISFRNTTRKTSSTPWRLERSAKRCLGQPPDTQSHRHADVVEEERGGNRSIWKIFSVGCVAVCQWQDGVAEWASPSHFSPFFVFFFCFRVCLFLILSRLRAELARNGCRLAISPLPTSIYIYKYTQKAQAGKRNPHRRLSFCFFVFLTLA